MTRPLPVTPGSEEAAIAWIKALPVGTLFWMRWPETSKNAPVGHVLRRRLESGEVSKEIGERGEAYGTWDEPTENSAWRPDLTVVLATPDIEMLLIHGLHAAAWERRFQAFEGETQTVSPG